MLIALAVFAAAPAHAENMLFAGAEASGHRSAFGQVGVVTPLLGSQLGNGWAVRTAVDGLMYKYRGAPGDVKADAVGGQLTMGYVSSGAPGWWSFFTGPVYRYTDLTPNDPSSDAQGGKWGLILQGEAERKITQDFKANFGASYIVAANNAYWTRLRLLYRISGEMFIGPEGIYQGDNDYNAWALGAALVGIELDKNTQLGLKAGVRKTEDFSLSPYGGVEMGYRF